MGMAFPGTAILLSSVPGPHGELVFVGIHVPGPISPACQHGQVQVWIDQNELSLHQFNVSHVLTVIHHAFWTTICTLEDLIICQVRPRQVGR